MEFYLPSQEANGLNCLLDVQYKYITILNVGQPNFFCEFRSTCFSSALL